MNFHHGHDATFSLEELFAVRMGAGNNTINGNSSGMMSQNGNGNGSSGLYPPSFTSASHSENGVNQDARATMSCSLSCSTPPSALLQQRQLQQDDGLRRTTEMSEQRMQLHPLLAAMGTPPSPYVALQTDDLTSTTNPSYPWYSDSSSMSPSPYHHQDLQLLLHEDLGVFEPRPIQPDTEKRLQRRRQGFTSATTSTSASTLSSLSRALPCFVSGGGSRETTTPPAPRTGAAEGPSYLRSPVALPGTLQTLFDDIQVARLSIRNTLRSIVDPDSSLPPLPSFELSTIGPTVQFHQQQQGIKMDVLDHHIVNHHKEGITTKKHPRRPLLPSTQAPSFPSTRLKSDMCAKLVGRQQVALQDRLERHSFVESKSDPPGSTSSVARNGIVDGDINNTENNSTAATRSFLEETKDSAPPLTDPLAKAPPKAPRKKPSTKMGDSKEEETTKKTNSATSTSCTGKLTNSTIQKVELDKHLMGLLQELMSHSASSQQKLQSMDERNGLPKSHCQTMVNSSRSRKQLQDGIILPKWNGAPLIDTSNTNNNNTGRAPPRRRRMESKNKKRKRCQD